MKSIDMCAEKRMRKEQLIVALCDEEADIYYRRWIEDDMLQALFDRLAQSGCEKSLLQDLMNFMDYRDESKPILNNYIVNNHIYRSM